MALLQRVPPCPRPARKAFPRPIVLIYPEECVMEIRSRESIDEWYSFPLGYDIEAARYGTLSDSKDSCLGEYDRSKES
jgi:hypothetical protein